MRSSRPLVVLLLVYTIVQLYAIPRLSINYDEESFLMYGITLLKGDADKDINHYESKLPITTLNALPRAVQQLMDPELNKINPTDDIVAGRYISLLVSIMLALLIYRWTMLWYGQKAGLVALIFYLLCPNILAHGIFLSSDVFAFLFPALSIYFLSAFYERCRMKDFLAFSFSFALAMITKFSLLHMLPVVMIIILFRIAGIGQLKDIFSRNNLGLLAIFIAVNWMVISSSHLFFDMFFPLNKFTYQSSAFKNLVQILGPIAEYIYVPLPSSYVRSIDLVMYFDSRGGGWPGALNGRPYILGQYSSTGFWYYYVVSFFYKLPIPFMLLLLTAIIAFASKYGLKFWKEKEIFLLVPVVYYGIYMSFFYSTQIGVRHLLIILPFLFVFSGFFLKTALESSYKWIMSLLLIWQFISVALYFPHFLPYTNEFILDKKNAYKKIADTNLSYREGRKWLDQYMDQHKAAVFEPKTPMSGTVIVDINNYLGLQDNSVEGRYDWLMPYEPVGHIHSQYLIFEIP